jgi:hypothetical protein
MRNPIRRLARRLRNLATARRRAAESRARYHQLDTKVASLMGQLARTAAHRERYALLAEAATITITGSRVLYAGWRDHQRSEDDRMAGLLLRMVAYAERALAHPGEPQAPPTTPDLERTAGPVLDAAVEAGVIDRAVLDALYRAVHPVVGRQAAEAIWCLPLPGNRSDYKLTG